MFVLKIDVRERDLIQKVKDIPQGEDAKFRVITESLDVGDMLIENEETKETILIIERKKVGDLASSIKDGRYKEQSFRLNGHPLHNHNIMYLIEGTMRDGRMDRNTLFSSVFSLSYVQGFSTWRTNSLDETAAFLMNTVKYVSKCKRQPFYTNNLPIPSSSGEEGELGETENQHPVATPDYVSVIKMSKKENITPQNISEIMLCQIPGISVATCRAILGKFKCLVDLIAELQEHGAACLCDVTIDMDNGKRRKIGKPAVANLMRFLIDDA